MNLLLRAFALTAVAKMGMQKAYLDSPLAVITRFPLALVKYWLATPLQFILTVDTAEDCCVIAALGKHADWFCTLFDSEILPELFCVL